MGHSMAVLANQGGARCKRAQSVPTIWAHRSCFKPFLWFLFQHFVCFFNRIGELGIQLALTLPVLSIRSISYTTNPSESFIGWSRICIRTIISIIQIIRCSIKYSNACVCSFHWNIFNDFWRFHRIIDITINTSFEVLFEVQGLIQLCQKCPGISPDRPPIGSMSPYKTGQ